MIGKAVWLAVATNDEMVKKPDVKQGAGGKQGAGQRDVGLRGVAGTRRMVVGDDQGRGIVGQGSFNQHPGIDRVAGQGALAENLTTNNGKGGIKIDNRECFSFQTAEKVNKIFCHIG